MLSPSRVVLSGLVGLAVLKHGTVLAATSSSQSRGGVITDDTYFYGQSPPVYPSRKLPPSWVGWVGAPLADAHCSRCPAQMTGGDWVHAHKMALDLVGKMTLEEKV